jgi:hypothetical protein
MAAPNGCQVGHTIRIHRPWAPTNCCTSVKAYKFGDADGTGNLFKREKDVSGYVRAFGIPGTWVSGLSPLQVKTGVKGKDNEARQMV